MCETGDFFARDREIPEVKEGDLVAILDTGAYGMSLSSNYNSRPRPAEVLVEGKKARLIRRRETIRDLVQPETKAGFTRTDCNISGNSTYRPGLSSAVPAGRACCEIEFSCRRTYLRGLLFSRTGLNKVPAKSNRPGLKPGPCFICSNRSTAKGSEPRPMYFRPARTTEPGW